MGVEFHPTNRGGDITYHGPGQMVGYPILHLGEIRRDVVWYVRQLEEAMIARRARLSASRRSACQGRTGVWVRPRGDSGETAATVRAPRKSSARSACTSAAGSPRTASPITSRRDLRYFDLIVPCGIADRRATSLEKLLGRPVPTAEVSAASNRCVLAVLSVWRWSRLDARNCANGWLQPSLRRRGRQRSVRRAVTRRSENR